MTKLFGTDGIRGEAGCFPLDEKTVCAIGLALAEFAGLTRRRAHPDRQRHARIRPLDCRPIEPGPRLSGSVRSFTTWA